MKAYNSISKLVTSPLYTYEFSICTFVTQIQEYENMLSSFLDKGFNTDVCEYLHIDNSDSNTFDAYAGINRFLHLAKGKYVIICHQDILINKDSIVDLRNHLSELDQLDQHWGLCGNAGAAGPNNLVYHISYPGEPLKTKGKFPLKVSSLDENFLLLKNDAYLKVSNNLQGFHLYGTDLCLQATLNGYNAYVIAFNLTHKSKGIRNDEFFKIRKALKNKYNRFFSSRWVQTNTTVFYLSGSVLGRLSGNRISLFFVKILNGWKKRRN